MIVDVFMFFSFICREDISLYLNVQNVKQSQISSLVGILITIGDVACSSWELLLFINFARALCTIENRTLSHRSAHSTRYVVRQILMLVLLFQCFGSRVIIIK